MYKTSEHASDTAGTDQNKPMEPVKPISERIDDLQEKIEKTIMIHVDAIKARAENEYYDQLLAVYADLDILVGTKIGILGYADALVDVVHRYKHINENKVEIEKYLLDKKDALENITNE